MNFMQIYTNFCFVGVAFKNSSTKTQRDIKEMKMFLLSRTIITVVFLGN